MSTATLNGKLPADPRGAAAYYLGLGAVPIPVWGHTKKPTLDGWQEMRPAPEDLDQLFPSGQGLNLGLLTGKPSGGLIDVDLDTAEAIAAGAVLLPATGWICGRNSKPRSHWFYRVVDPPDKAQDPYRALDGKMLVEVHSTKWHVVAPPSVHESGEAITWNTFTEPREIALADLMAVVRAVAAVAVLARSWPAKGSRQDAFLALAGGLLRAGWGQDRTDRFVEALAVVTADEEARKRVQTVAQTASKQEQDRKTTGWTRLAELLGPEGKEAVRRVRQWLGMLPATGAGISVKKVRMPEPYQPFPIEALPDPIREYVRQGARALGCDPAFLALPALAVVASAIGNTRTIRLKGSWEESSIVWSVVVAESGTLKTPAYLKAVTHLFRLQKGLLTEYREKAAQYEEELKTYKKAKEEEEDSGIPPEKPVLQRVVCSDTTVEKLAEILEDNPRGTLVARDELAGWLASFTRYKGKQGGTDLPNWLEMHRAGTVIVDRKTGDRRTLFVQNAAISVTGGIQPGVLARALTQEFFDAGLPARLLMGMPKKLPKRWSDVEISPEVQRAYHDSLDKLLTLDFDYRDDEQVPHVLTLSEDGKAAWIAFYNEWAREQADVDGELAAAFSKLEAYAARFALLHHVVSRVAAGANDLVLVERASIEVGAKLCRWFAREARRIYAILSESTDERETRCLVELIQAREGTITVRGLMRANCRRYRNAETAESALAALVDAGLARWVDPQTSMKGGKPIKAVELCMTHDTDDTDADEGDEDAAIADDTAPDTATADGSAPEGVSLAETVCDGMTPALESGVIGVMRHAEVPDVETGTGASEGGCRAGDAGEAPAVMRAPLSTEAHGETAPFYLVVKDRAGLESVAAAINDSGLVGLDVETTGLDPRTDCVRLLSLGLDTIDGGTFAYLVDCFAVDPSPLWEQLADKELVIHNAAFDLAFLTRLGFSSSGKVRDTMLLAHLLTAGTNDRISLAACCERWLGRSLDKAEQTSDWSGELTADQLTYAAADVEVLAPLFRVLTQKLKEDGLVEAAKVEQRCLPAVVWMGRHGVALDRDTWHSLARAADAEADRLRAELNAAAPVRPGSLFSELWNWDSTQQAKEVLALAGCAVEDTADETLAAVDHPLAELLRRYRLARKRGSTYGTDWLAHVRDDGRVYPSWRQVGAASGRMSCSDPNMQQLPRGEYRRCIVAPPGRVLVKADYSQIELRIAAKVSGDRALLEAYQRGEDLHTRTARSVLGIEDVTKQHRQLAKALNFGLLYGMGVRGFRQYAKSQYGLKLTEEEARRYRDAFFRSYPGLAAWHRRVRSHKTTETRTLAGRRRLLNDKTPDTHRLNTPVQGTGADGLKLALALLWERREDVPGAFPVLAVHDEIVIEADVDQAGAVEAWLKKAMVDAMAPLLEPVPVEVEVKTSRTWEGD